MMNRNLSLGIIIIGIILLSGCSESIPKPKSFIPDTLETMYVERIVYPEVFKGVLLELNIENDKLTLFESQIVNGYPNYLPGSYDFVARIYSFDEELLGEYGFGDPRIILGEQGYKGPTWLNNVNFTLIIPYFDDGEIVNIYSSNKLILSIGVPKG